MYTDYKFWFIRRDDDGFITEVAVRFYEGEYATDEGQQVYTRTRRLQTLDDLKHLARIVKGKPILKGVSESNGNMAVYYEPADFGRIKTDDELRVFLNKELAKDTTREPIEEQLWQP